MQSLRLMISSAAWAAVVIGASYAVLSTAEYLLQSTPQAVSARVADENAAAVRTAQDLYAASGCSTINGRRPDNLSYLPHVDCHCNDAVAESATANAP